MISFPRSGALPLNPGGDYTYKYDKARRLTKKNFPSGAWISYNYDPAKLGSIKTSDLDSISFAYTACGTKVRSITKGTEKITYGYDGSLITSETLSETLSQTLSYVYNNDFAVGSFTYAGDTCTYVYDNDGLLTDAGNFTITRNAGNGLPEDVSGGALSLTRTFSLYGETDAESFSAGGTGLFSWSAVRDDNGRITQKTETFSDGSTAIYEYDYDAVGRLLTVTKQGAGVVESYQYDNLPYGTRTYEERYGVERLLNYNDEDNLLTAGSVTYQHDDDGFLTSKTEGTETTTYDYSLRGELLRVDLPDGTVIEYVHDPLGRRIAKKVDGTVTEKYLWQGLTRLLAVYDGNDNLLMRFEYGDARMPVAMTKNGTTYYLAYDQVGTLKVVADASGNVVKKIEYDTFGNVISDSDPTFAVPFGFAGGLHDKDTGLVRFGYRDYDPETGRWTAKDPIRFAGGDTDLYGYCLNDPVSLNDPAGLVANWLIRLTRAGCHKIKKLSEKEAIKARQRGLNVQAKNRQTARRIEHAARGGNPNGIMRHKGHRLPDGSTGRPHYQTDGVFGHTFWLGAIGFIGSLLNPLELIAGELSRPEDYHLPCQNNQCD